MYKGCERGREEYQRYKDKRGEGWKGGQKDKEGSSERGREMYETGWLLKNKQEERQ